MKVGIKDSKEAVRFIIGKALSSSVQVFYSSCGRGTSERKAKESFQATNFFTVLSSKVNLYKFSECI